MPSNIALNDAGQAAYKAFLVGAGVDSTNYYGIYRFGDAGVVQIAREGDAAPAGTGNFTSLSGPVTLNNTGQATLFAGLGGTGIDSTNNRGIYRFGDAGVVQIARTGDAAPAGPGSFRRFGNPILNDAGQMAFIARVSVAGVDPTYDLGIYLYDELLGVLTVARVGDPLLGSTITRLGFNASYADENNGFNNLGQVAYQFELANGNSGIALFTIPEPTMTVLLTLGSLPLLLRRSLRVV